MTANSGTEKEGKRKNKREQKAKRDEKERTTRENEIN